MRKEEFLKNLKRELKRNGLSRIETEKALSYYLELIEEAVDGGETERAVIKRLGNPQIVALGIMQEIESTSSKTKNGYFLDDDNENEYEREEKSVSSTRYSKSKRDKGVNIFAIILFAFVFLVFILPVFISVVAVLFSVGISIFAVAFALIASGIAIPIYGIILGVLSTSLMLTFAYLSAGFLVFAIGLFISKIMFIVADACFKGIKYLVKICVKIGKETVRLFN